MNHFSYNIISRKIRFKIISLFKKMYFGKILLLCMLYMASACCLYDSAMNHPSPTMAVSNAATLEILPTSTEMGITGAMDIGTISDTEMVTKVAATASIVESQVIGTNIDEVVDDTATLFTATATPDAETSTNSSMFFMWKNFAFLVFLKVAFPKTFNRQ